MGVPVPPPDEPPVMIEGKFYRFTVDVFSDDPPWGDCTQEYKTTLKFCAPEWLMRNYWVTECKSPFEFAWYNGGSAQRVVGIVGPFDTEEDCEATL